MKEFDLFKTIIILTIVGVMFGLLSIIDYNGSAASWDAVSLQLQQPFEAKNWHYMLLVFLIIINGK